MAPHDQPGRPAGQPAQSSRPIEQTGGATPGSGQHGAVQQAPPVSEMTVSTPTLRWISIGHPQEQVPIGENDYVIESVFNPQMDSWEVLVLLQPGETDEDEDEEE